MLPMVLQHGYEPTPPWACSPWDTFLHWPGVYARQIGGAVSRGDLVLHEGIGEQADRGERTLTTLRELFKITENGYRLRSLSEVGDRSRQRAGQGP